MDNSIPVELIGEISTYLSYKDFKNLNIALKLSLLYSGRNYPRVLDELLHFSSKFTNKLIAERTLIKCLKSMPQKYDFADLLTNLIFNNFVDAMKSFITKFSSHIAIRSDCWEVISLDMASTILKSGFNPNFLYENDRTPLFFVSSYQVAKLLIEHGADVDAREKLRNETPLHAIDLKHLDIARLLLESGADVNCRNAEGETLVHYEIDIPFFNLIMEFGADINARDDWGITGIYECRDLELAKLFIRHGVDLNNLDNHGRTALFYAETVDIARLLLSNGADISIRDFDGLSCWEDSATEETATFYKQWQALSGRTRFTRYSTAFLAQ